MFSLRAASRMAERSDFMSKHGVDDDGMTLGENPHCMLQKDFVNLLSDLRPVCALGQPIRFMHIKQLLSQDICPQYRSTRQRRDTGREAARQNGFSGSGQPTNCDERRLWWTDRQLRKFEIGQCRLHDISLVVTSPVETSEQHIGTDGGA